ncbi:MAG: PAS domain S-box protein [Myxococcales bacterium]|nr:PAS domain S-box protein [Myxococcales bacterium]
MSESRSATPPTQRDRGEPKGPGDATRSQTAARTDGAATHAPDAASQWHSALDAVADVICVIDRDHRILEVNRAGCLSLGLPREAIIGRRCCELAHAGSSESETCPYCAARQTLAPEQSTYEAKGRTYELFVSPLAVSGGQPTAFVHVVRDVTDKRAIDEQLALFHALIQRSNDAIEVLDPETGRILDVNERGCLDLGYSRDEYLELTVFDIDPMVDSRTFAGTVEWVRRSGATIWEGIHRRKDGSTFPVEVSISHVGLSRGYLVAVVRDITERRKAEAVARRARDTERAISEILRLSLQSAPLEDVLQQALETILAISWLSIERSGAILLVNDKSGVLEMKAHVGLAPAIVQSCRCVPLGLCLCGRAAASLDPIHASDVDERHEIRYAGIRPHGHYCIPIVHAGRALGVFNIYLASGHPRVQHEIEFLTSVADTLAVLILRHDAERERQLAEEQLAMSQRLEAVGRLAGGLAHDFNNLLSVIICYASFAADALSQPNPVRDDVLEVLSAAERAAGLTRQLLAFSRKQVLQPEVLDLNAIISAIESMLRPLLGEDVEIVLGLADDLGRVRADPGQLEQVIMNLAVNARDAMPLGGKLIIETRNVELDESYAASHVSVKAGHHVLLSVSDTGIGMQAETLAQVFEPFFTTKERGKGTGLGLSMVYGIVKQSNGNIWAYSEPGIGTTFKIYLPRIAEQPARARRRPQPTVATGTETVLIVEDEDAVRRLAERILRGAGYDVHVAARGDEALRVCDELDGALDLLLTDVVMPQMSGRALAERLVERFPGLEVVYMSGYTDDAIAQHGILELGTRFVGKPFSAAELTRIVREALDTRAPRPRVERVE